MIAEDLAKELRLIAYSTQAKPANRVAACNSLARNGLDTKRVRETLFTIATDTITPDSVKVRAIDLLDKLEIQEPPKELSDVEQAGLEQSLLEKYVGIS